MSAPERLPSALPLSWLRGVLSVIVTLSVTLIAYGMVYNLGRPRNPHPDPLLAARLLPLELLLGVGLGLLAYRTFGRRLALAPRPDTQERMVNRLAMRRGGRFTRADLEEASPLSEAQIHDVLTRMLSARQLTRDGETYHLTGSGGGGPRDRA